jgi:hypothetical protein
MSVPQRVNDFNTKHRPKAVCNSCIAAGVGLINNTAHPAQITGALGTTSDFVEGPGTYSICKGSKKVIRRALHMPCSSQGPPTCGPRACDCAMIRSAASMAPCVALQGNWRCRADMAKNLAHLPTVRDSRLIRSAGPSVLRNSSGGSNERLQSDSRRHLDVGA